MRGRGLTKNILVLGGGRLVKIVYCAIGGSKHFMFMLLHIYIFIEVLGGDCKNI